MHKANAALNALVLALSNLPTTGPRVHKTRKYRHEITPALTIRLSSIEPITELSQALQESSMVVEVLYHVSGSDEQLDNDILKIDAEVWRAVMADRTLGGEVIATNPGRLTIDSSADGEDSTAEANRLFNIHIRHSSGDPEA